jgi:ribulose-phosphate 3-epimerase
MPKQLELCVDIAGANPLHLETQQAPLVAAGAECYVAMADGVFAPDLRGGAHLVRALRQSMNAKVCVHLLTEKPERHVEALIAAGATTVFIHLEATSQAHPTLGLLREAGVSPAIAVNPATALTKLEYVLPLVDRVLLLAREAGDKKAGLLPVTFDRVRILTEFVRHLKRPVRVEVCGCDSLDEAAKLVRFGATGLVLRDLIFGHADPAAAFHAFRQDIALRAARV